MLFASISTLVLVLSLSVQGASPGRDQHGMAGSPYDPLTSSQGTSAQSFVDQAAAGSTVTVLPGVYPSGLRLNKPLIVKLKGVVLTSVVDAKGSILVEGTRGWLSLRISRRCWSLMWAKSLPASASRAVAT